MAQSNHIERVSKNIGRTEEGYLVCRNAVIARTGYQTYRVGELSEFIREKVKGWFPELGENDDIEFYRSPKEVFSPATIESFEGKALTDEHPPELVNSENHAEYHCGHMAGVRKGSDALDGGEWPLMADIYITVDEAIQKYEGGVRELSCGYVYDVVKEGNRIFQVDLRGNHVALVPKGRAGSEVCINDAAPKKRQERRIMDRNDLITLGLSTITDPKELRSAMRIALDAAAKDAEEETEEEKKAREKREAEAEEKKKADDALTAEAAKKAAKDAEGDLTDDQAMEKIEAVREMLDDIEEHIEGGGEDEGEAEDASPEAKKLMVGSSKDAVAKDALTELNALKPFVARSRNQKLRGAYDSAVKRALPPKAVSQEGGGYSGFATAAERRSRAATDSVKQADEPLQYGSSELDKIYAGLKGSATTK